MGGVHARKKPPKPAAKVSTPVKEQLHHRIRVIVVGDSSVGKTCLINRFISDTYPPLPVQPGSYTNNILSKVIEYDNQSVRWDLVDQTGQERFRTICSNFYSGGHIVFLCFSVHDIESWNHIQKWKVEADRYCPEGFPILVGTQADDNGARARFYQHIRYFWALRSIGQSPIQSPKKFQPKSKIEAMASLPFDIVKVILETLLNLNGK